MNDFMKTYFGPLDKSSCRYFLILTIFFFVALVLTLLSEIMFLFKNFKQLNLRVFSSGILIVFNLFIAYFVNRLLYTMCSKTLA
jgi:hypothetical protein